MHSKKTYWQMIARLLNNVWSLYCAVGILILTAVLSYYMDFKIDLMHNQHLEIRLRIEKIIRLDMQLMNMVQMAVSQRDLMPVVKYDATLQDLDHTLKQTMPLAKSKEAEQVILMIHQANKTLAEMENKALSLMQTGRWNEAKQFLSGNDYSEAKQIWSLGIQKTTEVILQELAATEKYFGRIKIIFFVLRIAALFFLLFVGILYSRRIRFDMAEQTRLRKENEAVNIDLEKRIADRTEELERYSLQQEERANLEATISILNVHFQTAQSLREAAKYSLDAVVSFFKASRGAIFTYGEAGRFYRQATYAFPAESKIPDSFAPGEGTIGKCALKGEEILIAPADESFWLHFGVGSAPPVQVLTYPLKSSDMVVGVIELCLVEPIAEKQRQLLAKAAESIATAIRIALERQERRIAEERIHLILESTDEGIFGMDTSGYTTFVNPAACIMVGYDAEYIIGKHFHTMFHHSYADGSPYPAEECTMGRALRGERIQGIDMEVFWRHDGTMIPIEYSATPIMKDNEVIGAVVSFRDITERKKADALKVEKEVAEESAAEAERARQEAERAQEELKAKVLEIERFNRLTLGREERIMELKKQVNIFAAKIGEKPFYKEQELIDGLDSESAQADLPAPELETEEDDYTLSEILNLDQLQLLLTNFCESVGIAAAIIDLKGRILAAARWQRACTDFHRTNEKTCARCIESDTELALQLNEGKSFSVYQCRNGLIDAASPIIIDGRYKANVFVGQFFTSPPDLEFFSRQAGDCGLDKEQYLEAIKEVPIVEGYKLESILGFLVGMAQIVASMSIERNNARQAEVSMSKRADELRRERIVAMSLAEDADRSRLEIERFKEHLELMIRERTDELQQRAQELEDFNAVMIGRESRVIELKEEINALCAELGRLPAYPPVWDEPAQTPIEKGKEA
jgi:PAS domain S-box-containing protein